MQQYLGPVYPSALTPAPRRAPDLALPFDLPRLDAERLWVMLAAVSPWLATRATRRPDWLSSREAFQIPTPVASALLLWMGKAPATYPLGAGRLLLGGERVVAPS